MRFTRFTHLALGSVKAGAIALLAALLVIVNGDVRILRAQGYSISGAITKSITLTAASYAPSTHVDYIGSLVTLNPTSTVTAANGVNAVRGGVTLNSGKTLGDGTASFVTGVYGRNDIHGTVNIASGDLAAVYAKSDYSSATLTAGHIAPLQSNIVNPPANPTNADLLYAESAGGNPINSFFKAFGKSTYVFDLESNVFGQMSTSCTPSAVTGATGGLKVNVDGTTRWIPLAATCS